MEVIKNTGNYIVFGEDEEPDEGIWTDYKTETDRKIREYIEDLNSGENNPAGGLPRRPCAEPLRARLHAIPDMCRSCRQRGKASFRQGPRYIRHLKREKLTEETRWLKNILKQRASYSSWDSK